MVGPSLVGLVHTCGLRLTHWSLLNPQLLLVTACAYLNIACTRVDVCRAHTTTPRITTYRHRHRSRIRILWILNFLKFMNFTEFQKCTLNFTVRFSTLFFDRKKLQLHLFTVTEALNSDKSGSNRCYSESESATARWYHSTVVST